MMEPTYGMLIISNIFLWIVVIVLALVIFALTRQIGILYERVAPAGALAMNKNLKAGQIAPELALQTIDAKVVTVGGRETAGKSQLLFFLSPDCPVCKTLIPALKSATKAEADWLTTILCSDGMELDHQGYIKQQGLQAYPYIVSELLGKTYGVAKLPYAVVIDEKGVIASMGIINSREHMDSLFEAKEKNLASIQEYFKNNLHLVNPDKVKSS
jgi:methylamine dehydrogenase accessory protein MauD